MANLVGELTLVGEWVDGLAGDLLMDDYDCNDRWFLYLALVLALLGFLGILKDLVC